MLIVLNGFRQRICPQIGAMHFFFWKSIQGFGYGFFGDFFGMLILKRDPFPGVESTVILPPC
jgi:hypothetical protein